MRKKINVKMLCKYRSFKALSIKKLSDKNMKCIYIKEQ